jgi:hypothetical protein
MLWLLLLIPDSCNTKYYCWLVNMKNSSISFAVCGGYTVEIDNSSPKKVDFIFNFCFFFYQEFSSVVSCVFHCHKNTRLGVFVEKCFMKEKTCVTHSWEYLLFLYENYSSFPFSQCVCVSVCFVEQKKTKWKYFHMPYSRTMGHIKKDI